MKPIKSTTVIHVQTEMLQSPMPTSADAWGNEVNDIWHWVQENHRNNALLWDEEDLARRRMASFEAIAMNKRAIDGYNQARNDAIERMDELLLLTLGLITPDSAQSANPTSTVPASAWLSSETAGSMIDRLSILSLKIRAMTAQTQRTDVDATHRSDCQTRLGRLETQRLDLGNCLDHLLQAAKDGKAHFKVYRQFKMYNDPRFNPALVSEQRQTPAPT